MEDDSDDSEEHAHAGNDPRASLRRSTRKQRPNIRLEDYDLNIPATLVIQVVHATLEPMSVKEALCAPDATK